MPRRIFVNFEVSEADAKLIDRIARRAADMVKQHTSSFNQVHCAMDITAVHVNGNPLDLAQLAESEDMHFVHDVWGIRRHINRSTGQLENDFSPRFSK